MPESLAGALAEDCDDYRTYRGDSSWDSGFDRHADSCGAGAERRICTLARARERDAGAVAWLPRPRDHPAFPACPGGLGDRAALRERRARPRVAAVGRATAATRRDSGRAHRPG